MSEQSTFKFLLSKEGRGILIGTIILLVVVILIGVFTFNALFGSPEPRDTSNQGENAPPAGQTNVNASRQELRANVTSQGMNEEARAILNDYNDQADEFGLMPVPTPDNVELVDIDAESGQAEEPTGLAQNADAPQKQVANNSTRQPMTQQQREAVENMIKARQEALGEYRSARMEAASTLMTVYATPPANASVSFAAASSGQDEPQGTLPGVRRNADGSTSFFEGTEAGKSGDGQCETPLVKGGEIRYAQTDIALNTDFSGPVRMTFLDGNINGWVGMGSFELNELGARMKLTIDRLIDPDGQSYIASGYVLDPDTTLWAMASDVDHHVIYRYGGFGLGVILSAFGELADQREVRSEIINENGASSTDYREPDGKQVTWRLLGEFSRLFEAAFADNINRPITVKLDPNQEAGVLFEDTVCENDSGLTKARKAAETRAAQGFTDPVKNDS